MKKQKNGKKMLLTYVVTIAVMFLVVFVISKLRGPQAADGEEGLVFSKPYHSTTATCYVDGLKKKDYYEIINIPTIVTLSKLGQDTESDYKVIGVASEAFKGNTKIKEVAIPKSVTSIGADAFYGCTNIEKVTYEGSKSDWEKVSISNGNECLTKVNIEFK